MLEWEKLLCPTRRKELHGEGEILGSGKGRLESERDYDRILFSTPVRRLNDKTQVFPMEKHDSIRNRLTHSHEVSNLARSIGVRLAFDNAEKIFGSKHEDLKVQRIIPSMLAAVGLAHDLGNPPFGHQGEKSIQQWFNDLKEDGIDEDFLAFDGNAQTFRLLTRLQVLNDEYGLNLTLGTLAALLKYPSVYGSGENKKGGYKKYGVFQSESDLVKEVWDKTGLGPGLRHPLAYVMEACDDIAYSVIDAEDTVKKGYASFYDLMDFLTSNSQGDKVIKKVVDESRKKNNDFKKNSHSSRELNDISMQIFRVLAIAEMIEAATNVFVGNIDKIMNMRIDSGFELMKNSSCSLLCSTLKKFDYAHGFQHKEVLKIELEGNNYIKNMMTILWKSVCCEDLENRPFERYVFGSISENYRRIYDKTKKSKYDKCQLVCDAVSGMTESFLVEKHNEYRSLQNAAL